MKNDGKREDRPEGRDETQTVGHILWAMKGQRTKDA